MSIGKTPGRLLREAQARRRQERRWARKSGPVQIRFMCPLCGGEHAKADHPYSRTEVRTVECPACGAASGERCIGAREQQREANHRERIQARHTRVDAPEAA